MQNKNTVKDAPKYQLKKLGVFFIQRSRLAIGLELAHVQSCSHHMKTLIQGHKGSVEES